MFFSCICIYLCTPHVYLYIYGAASAKPPTPKGDGCSVLLLMVTPPVACGGGVFGMLVMGGMYVCLYVGRYVCMYVRKYVCMHACMYVQNYTLLQYCYQ